MRIVKVYTQFQQRRKTMNKQFKLIIYKEEAEQVLSTEAGEGVKLSNDEWQWLKDKLENDDSIPQYVWDSIAYIYNKQRDGRPYPKNDN